MKYRLRFKARKAELYAGVAGAAFLFPSCAPSGEPNPLVTTEHAVTYEVQIFDISAKMNASIKTKETLSAAEGGALIQRLKKAKATKSFSGLVGGRLGQKRTSQKHHEFVYPVSWDPPKLNELSSHKIGEIFPVTPATPTKFNKKQIGTRVDFTAGKNNVKVALKREVMRGFVNYGTPITSQVSNFWGRKSEVVITENRIEKPVFHTTNITHRFHYIPEGAYYVIRDPIVLEQQINDQPISTHRGGQPGNFIALIRVARKN